MPVSRFWRIVIGEHVSPNALDLPVVSDYQCVVAKREFGENG
jgi:hypothetical protein